MKQEEYSKYILYGDDDVEDQEIITELLAEIDQDLRLVCVSDGLAVLSYLENLHPDAAYPSIILLDLNMPRLDGFETLEFLKKKTQFNNIPTILFSTSSDQQMKKVAHKLGALKFITKPVKYDQLLTVIKELVNFCHTMPSHSKKD